MLTIPIFVILFMGVITYNVKQEDKKGWWSAWKAVGIGSLGIGSLIGVLFTVLLSLIFYKQFATYKDRCTHSIVSIRTENQTEGSFFLGTGHVEGTSYYFYYADLGDNQYQLCQVPTNRTVIREADESPEILIKVKTFDDGWKLWVFPIEQDAAYVITVPKGTIIKEFKL